MIDRVKRFAKENAFFGFLVTCAYYMVSFATSCLYILFRIFPVQKNKIVCCATKGKRYGDNPMYISDELLKNKENDIYWLMYDDVEADIPEGIHRVKYTTLNEIYHLATAAVWIDSNMKRSGILKRRNQLFVQTWHGSYGIKKIAYDLGEKLTAIDRKDCISNARLYDVMVSNSSRTTEIYKRALRYEGVMLEFGSPRNDVFFEDADAIKKKVYAHFGLKEQHIILYAPTFRNDYRTDDYRMDFDLVRTTMSKYWGGEWVILVRLHPNNLMDAKEFLVYNDVIINASDYSNMQDLLVASDVLISDYSSCMFDFVTTKRPCFIYASDVQKYKDDRDFYFDLYKLPFPLAENNDEMVAAIKNFDNDKYEKDLEALFDEVGLCESGTASKQIAQYIEEWMSKH